MSEHENGTSNLLHRRIHGELVDSLDEELELEIDDERLASLLSDAEYRPSQETVGRQFYFRNFFSCNVSSSSYRTGWCIGSSRS